MVLSSTDRELLQRAAAGELECYGEVFRRNVAAVAGALAGSGDAAAGRARGGRSSDHEDAVLLAAVFLDGWRCRHRVVLSEDGEAEPWLRELARRVRADRSRAIRRHRAALERLTPAAGSHPGALRQWLVLQLQAQEQARRRRGVLVTGCASTLLAALALVYGPAAVRAHARWEHDLPPLPTADCGQLRSAPAADVAGLIHLPDPALGWHGRVTSQQVWTCPPTLLPVLTAVETGPDGQIRSRVVLWRSAGTARHGPPGGDGRRVTVRGRVAMLSGAGTAGALTLRWNEPGGRRFQAQAQGVAADHLIAIVNGVTITGSGHVTWHGPPAPGGGTWRAFDVDYRAPAPPHWSAQATSCLRRLGQDECRIRLSVLREGEPWPAVTAGAPPGARLVDVAGAPGILAPGTWAAGRRGTWLVWNTAGGAQAVLVADGTASAADVLALAAGMTSAG